MALRPASAVWRVCALLTVTLMVGEAHGAVTDTVQDRTEDPVIVPGSILPALFGEPIGQIYVFRYDAGTNGFVPIPYQVDQRVDYLVNPGGMIPVHELMYDVFGTGSGQLGANDEIAFLYDDAGGPASSNATWPAGADPVRFEIRVADPRPGGPFPDRFAYVFTGLTLARSSMSYVAWDAAATSDIGSSRFDLGFTDRWLLTGYAVESPCGSGEPLLDRVKGRAGLSPQQAESEEIWNTGSTYLGGIAGPVRAIRYVQGAASGVNTILRDIVYRGYWERSINLRVHSISGVWFYFDLLPVTGTTFYSSTVTGGVAVDGQTDSSVGTTIPSWTIFTGPAGGLAAMYTVAPSPFVGSETFYYRDDATYDDRPSNEPGYTDPDPSAIGDHGIKLGGITSQSTDTIPFTLRFYPLCANEGDAALGSALRQLVDDPLQPTANSQSRAGSAVQSLMAARSGDDVGLGWPAVSGALSYNVYEAPDPDLPHDSWTLIGNTTTPGFIDLGAISSGDERFYSVTAVGTGGEGPW